MYKRKSRIDRLFPGFRPGRREASIQTEEVPTTREVATQVTSQDQLAMHMASCVVRGITFVDSPLEPSPTKEEDVDDVIEDIKQQIGGTAVKVEAPIKYEMGYSPGSHSRESEGNEPSDLPTPPSESEMEEESKGPPVLNEDMFLLANQSQQDRMIQFQRGSELDHVYDLATGEYLEIPPLTVDPYLGSTQAQVITPIRSGVGHKRRGRKFLTDMYAWSEPTPHTDTRPIYLPYFFVKSMEEMCYKHGLDVSFVQSYIKQLWSPAGQKADEMLTVDQINICKSMVVSFHILREHFEGMTAELTKLNKIDQLLHDVYQPTGMIWTIPTLKTKNRQERETRNNQ